MGVGLQGKRGQPWDWTGRGVISTRQVDNRPVLMMYGVMEEGLNSKGPADLNNGQGLIY